MRKQYQIILLILSSKYFLIRLLQDYRKKCQSEFQYNQAKRAEQKIRQIREKEEWRKKNRLKIVQVQEMSNIEDIQRNQFAQFTTAWNNYMQQYENSALESLEKLKQKHLKSLQEFQHKLYKEMFSKIKYSKKLLELRTKQKNLVKLRKYDEAEKVKQIADHMEAKQKKAKEIQIKQSIQNKTTQLRKQQQQVLSALIKKIHKDRTQQLKQRQLDSQRMMIKIRNLKKEMTHRHAQQSKKFIQTLRQDMSLLGKRKNYRIKSSNRKNHNKTGNYSLHY